MSNLIWFLLVTMEMALLYIFYEIDITGIQ